VAGYRPDLSKLVSVKLPDGASLEIPEMSFVHDVHKYLADAANTKPRAFVFEPLTFDGSTVKAAPETDTLVKILSTLLKSYPTVTIRVDGHTDRTSDSAADRQVSRDRAASAKELFVKAGIPADRVTIEAFGSEKPVAPNDTEENRAKNRRIELTIERK
jgi:outer membrane protein OmpA-like peptidoglycan-associated protein